MFKPLFALVLVAFVAGCAGTVGEAPTEPETCSDQFDECVSQFTASVTCLDGSCTCAPLYASTGERLQGEGVFFSCRNGAPDGLHNRSLGLP